MNEITKVLFFLTLVALSSCMSYTQSMTKGNEPNTEFFLTALEPGKTYKVKLRSLVEYKVKVTSVDADSLHGLFSYIKDNKLQKAKSRVSLQDISEVKEPKIDLIKTVLAVGVPVGIIALAISGIEYNLSGWTF